MPRLFHLQGDMCVLDQSTEQVKCGIPDGGGPESPKRRLTIQGYQRLQLKHGGQYLDADHCGSTISLNPGSDWEGGACQLWRFVPIQ
ncbi:MAG: hypothetical protein CV088_00895 [Nitrospira sp. LK70]|nr:hypothetical protein [Nitrospira sp. LK70]